MICPIWLKNVCGFGFSFNTISPEVNLIDQKSAIFTVASCQIRETEMSKKHEAELLEDLGGIIKLYSDGSVVRGDEPSFLSHFPDYNKYKHEEFNYKHVEYKDVVMDEGVGLWARLFLPPETTYRLPVILFYLAGGFVLFCSATSLIHQMCQMWAATLGPFIISVNYRVAPEHRLPAAYHDSIAALQWLQLQAVAAEAADPWLRSHADFSRVFLAGESAAGKIAHHVGAWEAGAKEEIKIKGLVLVCPFFGGEERTSSESEKENSAGFSLEQSDAMWRLALPVGSNRDHPFSNPLIEGAVASALDLPPMLFVIVGRDILRDRQLQFCELLKKRGKQICVHVADEEDHGFLLLKVQEPRLVETLRAISDFIK